MNKIDKGLKMKEKKDNYKKSYSYKDKGKNKDKL